MKENLEGRCVDLLDKFIYVNHLGQRFDEECVYLNYSDLRDYLWSFDTLNSRISRFYRSTTERKLPLVIVGKTGDEATAIKNRLFEIAEADIVAMIPGKIYSGEYYTQGYITGSAKSKYLINKRFCKLDLTLTSDDPAWYREHLHRFFPTPATAAGEGRDFPFDYSYDYKTKVRTTRNIECDSISGNAFKIVVYGEVTNPSIKIGNHEYSINGTVGTGESLLIDGLAKKITLTSQSGQQLNWFDRRNRNKYIFESIPNGVNNVSWDGSFGFDLTVIEKRSEPRWT